MSSLTIFERILRREIPADVVFEDDHVLAFRDVNPQAPVHVLVVPKKKFGRFAALATADTVDVGAFFVRVAKVAEQLGLERRGYRVVLNNGDDAGQTVEYLHAHILGGRPLGWPPG